jgi:hypothetical protein
LIAEIYGKISKDNSNLTTRSEDELTGNFFGNMRYLPYTRGLKKIFDTYAQSPYDKAFERILHGICDDEFEFEFWQNSALGYGEIDALMFVGGVAIGIEVKLYSGLSGEDQLEREADMLNEWHRRNTPKLLMFVAPESSVKEVYLNNYEALKNKGVHLGYITWESIFKGLDNVKTVNKYEKLIIQDLKDLLAEKGFASFEGFDIDINVKKGQYYEFG